MAIKKSTTRKAANKAPAKKATTKKVAAKKAAKKVAAKKVVKKAPAKKAAKKVAAKKVTKKAPAKKVAAKKAPAKKTESASKAAKTAIIANVDVGFGNSLYIRGEGAGLSWEKGTQLDNVSPYEWAFSTTKAKGEVVFKFLINDEAWADGDDLTVESGGSSISSPTFS